MEPDAATVEVVYALPQEQFVATVPWHPGLTAERAVRESRLLERIPEAGRRPLVLGVFGARVSVDTLLQPGDRVEICRPLLRDPRDLRRELARQGRVVGFRTPE